MRLLHQKFPEELVIIGVHSAKFPSEKLTENIREAILRHHIDHPVVNDIGFDIWSQYTVHAWPTLVLIDAVGKVVGMQAGEIQAEDFIPIIEQLIAEAEAQGLLDRRPLDLRPEKMAEPTRILNYPGKLLISDNGHLFVADTGHHRILELVPDEAGSTAEILRAFGGGEPGLKDGPAAAAAFDSPHGLLLLDQTLYVADTDNHAIRAIDLETETVTTIAGTGEKGMGLSSGSSPTDIALRSPWALATVQDVLLIAMAGSHQIWLLSLVDGPDLEPVFGPFAGNGREALVDGPLQEASFNQPSDIAFGMSHLFVADAEASAIRAITLNQNPEVVTLIGLGLFEFGDVDGHGSEVRLQHPIGLTYHDGLIYIADSYNHKIKTLDPTTGTVQTLIGSGQAGSHDGPFDQAALFEPEGLCLSEGKLYIADTNNHLIRVADLTEKRLYTLTLRGMDRLRPARLTVDNQSIRQLKAVTIGAGNVEIALEIILPDGYKLNAEAPQTLQYTRNSVRHRLSFDETPPTIPLTVETDQDLDLDLTLYYCQTDDQRLCLIHNDRFVLPLHVAAAGPKQVQISYDIKSQEIDITPLSGYND